MMARSLTGFQMIIAAWALLALASAPRAVADPAAGGAAAPLNASLSRTPDVVIVVDPMQDDAEPFVPVVGGAAQFKLQSVGLSARIDTALPSENVDPIPRAQRAGAAAALVCSYSLQGRQMAVTISWYDVAAGTAAASVDTRGDVDLHLDDVILGLLDNLLGRVKDRVRALVASGNRFVPSAVAPGQDQGAPLEPAHPQPAGPADATRAVSPQEKQAARLLIAGGFAPFVPTGAASAYFGVGYLPSTLVSVLLPTRAGPVGVGLYTGMDYFSAVGSLDTSQTFLIPIGMDVRYEIGSGALRPWFHVAGGPALLVMQTGGQGTISGVMPFLRSGIGVSYRFGQRVGAAIAADYDVYFEMPYLITGFSPSVLVEVVL